MRLVLQRSIHMDFRQVTVCVSWEATHKRIKRGCSCPGTSGSYQDMTTSDALLLLSKANIRYGDLLEKVRRSYGAWGIRLQRVAKFRPAERLPEVCHRLPDRIVDEHSASADTAVQLSRDESGLLFEECGVSRPRIDELIRLSRLHLELINEDYGTTFKAHLLLQRNCIIHLNQFQHCEFLS